MDLSSVFTDLGNYLDGILDKLRFDIGRPWVTLEQRSNTICQIQILLVEQLQFEFYPDCQWFGGGKFQGGISSNSLAPPL